MATTRFARLLTKEIGRKKITQGLWYNSHMAAASRAITERIPLVDLIVEVRDARIPLSSDFELLRNQPASSRQIIVLNKMDLADRSNLQAWVKYFKERNCISYGVNAHNKENIKQVRELRRMDHASYTATVMLVGIPNVGKSALANALHQTGRIRAAEKGKLRHAIVSPEPGETKDIRSFKIASHPNIYVLDTPAVLPPEIRDVDLLSKLILTGAIGDCLFGKKEIAQYFLAILNSSEQYKKWAKLSKQDNDALSLNSMTECLTNSGLHMKQQKQLPTDHTQDYIVRDVRRTLFETISSFDGNIRYEEEMETLIARQFTALQEAFQISTEFGEEDAHVKVAGKLLDLFRTGRLGHYTFDHVPTKIH